MRIQIDENGEGRSARHTGETHAAPGLLEIEMDVQGIIRDCNADCERLVGYRRSELIARPITLLIEELSHYPLFERDRLNPHLVFICHCGMPFRVRNKAGEEFFSELKIIQLPHMDATQVRLLACPLPPAAGH